MNDSFNSCYFLQSDSIFRLFINGHKASNLSLHQMRLIKNSANYSEKNFIGSSLLDGFVSLWPIDPDLAIDLHIGTAVDLH